MAKPLVVRPISADEHQSFIRSRPSVSFLQTPAWAKVKNEWQSESVGWFDNDLLVGAALVLRRPIPKMKWSLAYIPEGPVIDYSDDLDRWLEPLVSYLKTAGAFAVRIGPPVLTHAWLAPTIKNGIADENLRKLTELPADISYAEGIAVTEYLRSHKWIPVGEGEGFAAGQPAYNFTVSLIDEAGLPLSEEAVLAGMNQLWRRNIKKAAKLGVEVIAGTRTDLADFHRVYLETAERDGFTGRPLFYFERMWDSLIAEDPDRIRLFLARHEGDLVAATIYIQVGSHAWYSYGASTSSKREVRGSNAIQWHMMREALARGAQQYDLRGITETVDSADPQIGLLNFKVGTGGRAVHYCGEWDLPIRGLLYRAFTWYLARRG